jgi:hypothetical protein
VTDDESFETADPAAPTSLATAPAERYGRTPGNRRRNRLLAIAAAAVFAVVLVAWVVWAGLDGSSADLDAEDTSHSIIDAHSVSVGFNITMPRGDTASCALQAQNDGFAIVGWKIVDIPASKELTTEVTETVRTTELAVTGLIYRCWLT